MDIYIFKSEAKEELRAFAGDEQGSRLPDQFRPWHAVGVASAGKTLPHKISRVVVEGAIEAHGFQLWRIKRKDTDA
jgi:hypothetical protein